MAFNDINSKRRLVYSAVEAISCHVTNLGKSAATKVCLDKAKTSANTKFKDENQVSELKCPTEARYKDIIKTQSGLHAGWTPSANECKKVKPGPPEDAVMTGTDMYFWMQGTSPWERPWQNEHEKNAMEHQGGTWHVRSFNPREPWSWQFKLLF